MKRFIAYCVLTMLICSGCDQLFALGKIKEEVPEIILEPTAERIKSPELAKVLLKPKQIDINIERDPFKPLLLEAIELKKKPVKKVVLFNPDDYQYLGLVRMDGTSSVLMKVKQEKAIYKMYDKIDDFTIKDIQSDQVTLDDGKNIIILKRGE